MNNFNKNKILNKKLLQKLINYYYVIFKIYK